MSVHSGHRERLKKRFEEEGLDHFVEHQALELLLFYAIPRKDTNELAHCLLQNFGSIKNLFEAEVGDIANIAGISTHTATLIKLVPALAAKYWFSDRGEKPEIASIESAVSFARSLLYGKSMEHFYLVCLDASYHVKKVSLLSRGTPTETPVYIRHIIEELVRTGTDKVLIAHNHPGGKPQPSNKDIELTSQIVSALEPMQIELIDHIIVSDGDCFSFAARQLIKSDFSDSSVPKADSFDELTAKKK